MAIQKVIELFRQRQRGFLRKNTLKSYGEFLSRFEEQFTANEVALISAKEIVKFLDERT